MTSKSVGGALAERDLVRANDPELVPDMAYVVGRGQSEVPSANDIADVRAARARRVARRTTERP